MKNSSSLCIWMMGLILLASSMLPVEASGQQKPEPSAIIAIAPLDEQLNDVEYLASAASETIGQMSGLVRFQAQGFLPGVDFSKPSGAFLYFKEGESEPESLAFFPVKNFDELLDKISEFAEVEEEGGTVTVIPDSGEEINLVKKNGYVFASDKAEMLENLPENPESKIAEQTKLYNFSAKVFPEQIPESLKQQLIDFIRQGFEASLDQMDDLQAELQEANFEMQMKQMEMLLNETERLMIGLNADKATERIYFDVNMKGKANSEMEKKLTTAKKAGPSQFLGFLMDKAAFTLHNCSGISKQDAELYLESLKNVRDTLLEEQQDNYEDGQIAALENLSNKLIESVKKTLMAGTLDMGAVAFTDDGLNAAFGLKIVDARDLESSIKEIVAEAESQFQNDQVVFNLNSGSHNGFNLHEITIDVDEEELDEAFTKMFGDKVNVILGIGDEKVYVSVGKDPAATLKKSIDANSSASGGTAEFIGQYNFFVAPIMNLVSQIETEAPLVEDMRDKIAEVGKDRVRVTYDVVNKEMKVRMEVQDGILQLFGVAAESMQGMGGGADF